MICGLVRVSTTPISRQLPDCGLSRKAWAIVRYVSPILCTRDPHEALEHPLIAGGAVAAPELIRDSHPPLRQLNMPFPLLGFIAFPPEQSG